MRYSAELNASCPYASQVELDWLRTFADTLSWKDTVVIIGAGPGVMPIAMLESPADFRIVVVENTTFQWLDTYLERGKIERTGRLSRIFSDSHVAGEGWTSGPIRLVVVDGDHTEEGVTRDIAAWHDHVAIGGFIAFHDTTHPEFPGIALAIADVLPPWFRPIALVDSLRIYRREKR